MPRRPEWIHRLPEALERLGQLTAPTLDRQAVEILFGVSPRQALRILHQLAGHQAGQALVIGRAELRAKLEALAHRDDVLVEQRRHGRVGDELARLRATEQARHLTIPPPARPPALESLPASGIRLSPGRLEITFRNGEELLGRLLELAQAVADDPARFHHATDTSQNTVE
ncbi:MAG: hypothetical protein IT162_03475 [Bryobacterales bacterium]|nr:hypothetical protein [Bryobacterales bacterium]